MNSNKFDSESLKLFAAGVAHDFNNVLATIQANIESVLVNPSLSEFNRRSLEGALLACRNGVSLGRSLVGYSRQEALTMRKLILSDLVHDVAELGHGLLGKKYRIWIGPEVDQLGPVIVGCYESLTHVLLNLIKNGKEAMPGGGNIFIQCVVERGYTHLYIRDEGTGMSKEVKDQATIPFFSTKSNRGRGMGLGLAMVKEIMEQHSGRISIDSEMGKGTIIVLSWPIYNEEEVHILPEENEKEYEQAITQNNKRFLKRTENHSEIPKAVAVSRPIYVVDDEHELGRSLTSLISRIHSCEVIHFESGEQALEAFTNSKLEPQWMFVDHSMPGMSGIQLIERVIQLRKEKDQNKQSARLVLMSGYPPENFRKTVECFSPTPVYLLTKPFSVETLNQLFELKDGGEFMRRATSRMPSPCIRPQAGPSLVKKSPGWNNGNHKF